MTLFDFSLSPEDICDSFALIEHILTIIRFVTYSMTPVFTFRITRYSSIEQIVMRLSARVLAQSEE